MVEGPGVSEAHKQRLIEHVLTEVMDGVSGRDLHDIVDVSPSRALFAGVLQPYRENPSKTSVPSSTSLGIDFRVRPRGSGEALPLLLKLSWSVYYPVFPTWDQVLATSGDRFTESDRASVSNVRNESDVAAVEEEEDGTDAEQTEDDQAVQGRLILPRVFRRKDVEPAPITVTVTPGSRDVLVGQAELGDALLAALQDIHADPMRWRHLSDPKKNERELGEGRSISSEAKYAQALKTVVNPHVRLPNWAVQASVDCLPDPLDPGLMRVRVLLTNLTPSREEIPDPDNEEEKVLLEPDLNLQERALFDARLEVSVVESQIIPFDFLLAPADYRSRPQMIAKGINCVAIASESGGSAIRTESLPLFKQPFYRTRDDLRVKFGSLQGESWDSELSRVEAAMVDYLQRWDEFLESSRANALGAAGLAACRQDRKAFTDEMERFRLGVQALKNDTRLARAFSLMNTAFGRLAKASGGRVSSWHLFQIAFIVSQLPSLAVRELTSQQEGAYAAALRSAATEVGILWFPTGGGKTEAYLGLISTALLYDRLRGKLRGVSAWMRFPLRMLSLQQLERLGRVIGALNTLRASTPDISKGDLFAIGYYVGDAVTPNSVSEEDMKKFETDKDYRHGKRLLRKCFFCTAPVELRADAKRWRLSHVCTNEKCFSNTDPSMGELIGSLPVFIVDNEIYRYLPSVLVGTVDKLAIIGRNRSVVHIVRGVTQRCPTHGYCSYNDCIERWSGCKVRPKQLVELPPIKDPGLSLLIQDEFHLLRAELGVFNGHYEGLLQYLGGKAYLPPKILAATATIEAYDIHAFHIYLSKARRFPQPSWEQGESFYATSSPRIERRYYVGVRCHTRAVEDPTLRLLGLYQGAIRRLKNDLPEAVRIMGAPMLTEDTAAALLRLYDLSLVYVNKKATGGSVYDKLGRTEQLFMKRGLGTITAKLLTGDQGIEEVGSAIDRIVAEKEPTEDRLDIVIATNLISHGVDLERINMMAVAGMPSHYAEYVQSTSRAARSHPGLVFVCFMARDARELSQYEFFPAMHENMDRLIEAVAVNRFATFAPRKTVPGLLSGLLLCDATPRLFAAKKIKKPLEHVPTLKAALGIAPNPGTETGCLSGESLVQAVEEIIGVTGSNPLVPSSQAAVVQPEVDQVATDCLDAVGRALEMQLKDVLNPITSFRDVDEGLEFGSVSSSSVVTRLRAR